MGWKENYARFAGLAESPETDVVSVDVFDTLLFRTTLPEPVKFHRFGKRMYDALPVKPKDVGAPSRYMQQLRLLAARTIYHQKPMVKGAREATLDEIYDFMVFALKQHIDLTDTQCQQIIAEFRAIERSLEVTDLSRNERLVTTLARSRAAGKKVVAVSDMYLRLADLEYLLEKFELRSLLDAIYVSSEYGYSKASGALYDTVMEDLGVEAAQVCHIGDNYHSDFAVPSSKGITAMFAPRPKWWRLTTRVRHRLNV